MSVKDPSFVDAMQSAGQVNTDHSVPAPMDTLETQPMKKWVARKNYAPITRIVQEIAFVKNTDVSLPWKVSVLYLYTIFSLYNLSVRKI